MLGEKADVTEADCSTDGTNTGEDFLVSWTSPIGSEPEKLFLSESVPESRQSSPQPLPCTNSSGVVVLVL